MTSYDEYSENKPKSGSSKKTASAYMSVMRYCMGPDMALPAGYAGSEPMEIHVAAAYVRSHMARTNSSDPHYLDSCKETEQMMQEHGL